MIDVLREAGIENYTIFESDNELFGYYECEKGVAHAAAVQANSAVVARWNAYPFLQKFFVKGVMIGAVKG